LRIVSFDIETSNLSAGFGTIICAGFKTVGEGRAKVLSIADFPGSRKDGTNDKPLVKAIYDELMEADIWLTWYGQRFDIPFVNSRLLYHNLPLLPANHPHIDGWKTSRNHLKLGNNRLNTVQSFLRLPDEKTHIKPDLWIKAIAGNRKALKYIEDHCKADVVVLEQAYERLRPLILDHPFTGRGVNGNCAICGEGKLQKRGFHRSRTRVFQRYQCQGCGSWSRDKNGKAASDGKVE